MRLNFRLKTNMNDERLGAEWLGLAEKYELDTYCLVIPYENAQGETVLFQNINAASPIPNSLQVRGLLHLAVASMMKYNGLTLDAAVGAVSGMLEEAKQTVRNERRRNLPYSSETE